MLVYFAMLAFGLLALAALVIDVGFAFVTRRQMQTAADAAALAGLRFRDELPPFELEDVEDCDCGTAREVDSARRKLASLTVSYLFDDDLDLADDPRAFGAGPIVAFSEDASGQSASQTLIVPDRPADRAYKPQLRCNCANEPHGDLVAGRFEPNPAFDPPVPDNPRIDEDADGDHRVLVPDTPGQAFLARLRRADDPRGLDEQEGVSSSGPPLPYLFGRGSLLAPEAKGRGITVRATALADARPVMAVGPPVAAAPAAGFAGAFGVTPLALSRAAWADEARLPLDQPTRLTADALGNLTTEHSPAGSRDGQFVRVTSIGHRVEDVDEPAAAWDASTTALARYLPIFDSIDGVEWIVGFGLVDIAQTEPLTITKRRGVVARENASAAPVASFTTDPSLAAALPAVLAANRGLPQAAPGLVLLAPTLVR